MTLTAALGIAAIAGGFQGWALRRATPLERVMLIVAGVALVYPGGIADAVGLSLIVAVLAMQRFMAAPAGRARQGRLSAARRRPHRHAPPALQAARRRRARRRSSRRFARAAAARC